MSAVLLLCRQDARFKNKYFINMFITGVYENFVNPKLIIDISDIRSLKRYEVDQNLILGANTSLEDCIGIFKTFLKKSEFAYLAGFVKHFELIAHVPVRKVRITLVFNFMIAIYMYLHYRCRCFFRLVL